LDGGGGVAAVDVELDYCQKDAEVCGTSLEQGKDLV
jgi:hypothetical protein